MNRAKIDAAQTARELAERRLEAEQKKFDLGASTYSLRPGGTTQLSTGANG
jgi:hypothetical protein